MVWGRGHVLRILDSRKGSSPLAAPSFRIATANSYRDWFAISLQKKPNWFESSINAILLVLWGLGVMVAR
jgi:hypothetical protein